MVRFLKLLANVDISYGYGICLCFCYINNRMKLKDNFKKPNLV